MKFSSLRTTYMLLLFSITLPVFIFFAGFNSIVVISKFYETIPIIVKQSQMNLTQTIQMRQKSYELAGNLYTDLLIKASQRFEEAYMQSGDIDKIDYTTIKHSFDDLIELYVIDNKNTIIRSTFPPSLGLVFTQENPHMQNYLDKIRKEKKRFLSHVSDDAITGKLRKWIYKVTPDQRYIFEIGINDNLLSKYVLSSNYQDLVEKIIAVNPLIKNIRIFSMNHINRATGKVNIDNQERSIIAKVFSSQKSYSEYDAFHMLKRIFFYLPAQNDDLQDTDNVVSIEYDYSQYMGNIKKLAYHIILAAGGYFLFTLLIIYWTTKRIITNPLNRLSKEMKDFTQRGTYTRLKPYKNNEIGDLINNYNDLVDELQRTSQSKKYFEVKSNTDYLTQLYNRQYIIGNLHAHCHRYLKKTGTFSFIIWDIDFFKTVNDTYGHQAGDVVLKEVAEKLQEFVGLDGIVGRYGGEEFIAVLGLNHNSTLDLAETIRTEIKKITFLREKIHITLCAGIVSYDEAPLESNYLKLISFADQRLYQAKKSGRDKTIG